MPRTSRVQFLQNDQNVVPPALQKPRSRRDRVVQRDVPFHDAVMKPDASASGQAVPNDVRVAEVSHYVAQITAELAHLSRDARLDVLAYFLEMARMEAVTALNGIKVG